MRKELCPETLISNYQPTNITHANIPEERKPEIEESSEFCKGNGDIAQVLILDRQF
jgi:hypothetical protein